MSGLRFEFTTAVPETVTLRADIACFIGFVPPHDMGKPQGPLFVDSWEAFQERIPYAPSVQCADGEHVELYLGAAVRSFFSQGGQICYVVAVTAPVQRGPATAWESWMSALLPGFPGELEAMPDQRRTWRGLGAILGLPDVSWVCLPDLAPLCSSASEVLPPLASPPAPKAMFLPALLTAEEEVRSAQSSSGQIRPRAPRCVPGDLQRWASGLRAARNLLQRYARSVQLVAAVPLAGAGDGSEPWLEAELLPFLNQGEPRAASLPSGFASSFVQLVYPWLRTLAGEDLAEGLEPPEGAFIGALARSARQRGAFLSATRMQLVDVLDLVPTLSHAPTASSRFREVVSMIGRSPSGYEIQSDVTCSPGSEFRPASVGRLLGIVLRAVRRIGEQFAFETTGGPLCLALQGHVSALLSEIWREGGLQGQERGQAFQVRCDPSTTTQEEIDAGRVVIDLQLHPIQSLEQMTVSVILQAGDVRIPANGVWA